MAFLIRTIDYTAAGREIVRERTLEQDRLSIGRAAENDIHLPDLAVEQNHVSLHETPDGKLSVEAVGTLGFGVDGRIETDAAIDPATGAEVSLGSSRLAIAREGDGTVSITIRQAESNESKDALRGFALGSALPSKRAMSWAFAAIILIVLLSIPIVTHLTRTPMENDPENLAQGQVLFDAAWSSGELSLAHHDLENNCEACHVTPFVSVQDTTCLTCHEELGDHAEMPRLAGGMPPLSTGDRIQWDIAQTLGKEGPLGCVSCHTEHEGSVELEAASEQFCADCHNTLDTRLTNVSFANAADFGQKHPQFRPAFYTEHHAEEPVRVSLDESVQEMSGLKFPHDVHMDAQGGVARMAISIGKYGAPLECADCHTAEADGIGFAPVEMEPSCESCHSLVSGRNAGGFTSLRHGDVDELMEDLAKVNLASRRPVASGRSRPGQFARGGRYYSNFGRPMGAYLSITNALSPRGVCGECHLPTRTGGRTDITPVNLPDRFLLHGFFNHDAHGEDVAECTDCHAADTSSEANDLLIPDVESCRDCHLGATAAKTEEIVPSSCAMCHGYHTPTMPWSPGHPEVPQHKPDTVAAIANALKR